MLKSSASAAFMSIAIFFSAAAGAAAQDPQDALVNLDMLQISKDLCGFEISDAQADANPIGTRVKHQVFRTEHGVVLLGNATPIEDKRMRGRVHVEQAGNDLPVAVINSQEIGSINEVA